MNIASILQKQLNVIKLGHYGAGVFLFPFFIFIISFSLFFSLILILQWSLFDFDRNLPPM